MVKGSIAKAEITKKILETFEGAFVVDSKELRIPWKEDGVEVQIKIAMTCAKENIAGTSSAISEAATPADRSLTEAEKTEVRDLIKELGL